jgi:hypothetical protein
MSAIELFHAFSNSVEKIPLNMIGLDSINKVVNNLPKTAIEKSPESSAKLIDFYFRNIDSALKMHYEMTLLSLSWLIRNCESNYKTSFLELLRKEVSSNTGTGSRNIFLLDIQREVEGSLSREQATYLADLVIDKMLSPKSDTYTTETFGAFDNLLISTKSFDFMPPESQTRYVEKLKDCLLDNRSSISTKTRVIQAIDFLSAKIEKQHFETLDDFISRNRERLFVSTHTEDLSPFRSSSFVNFRALLYSCSSYAPVKKPLTFSLDLLRLSVSTEAHVRGLFAETVVSFVQSNPDCSGNLSLLHRCYELTFDSDPKVRGKAISSIIELFNVIDSEIQETYLLRISDLLSDPSEISRAYLALSLSEFKDKIPSDVSNSAKRKLEEDVSYYVRRNINQGNNKV